MIICSDQRTGQGCGGANGDAARFCVYCGQSLRFGLALHNPGSEVGGYRVGRVLGHGMFGAVYEGEGLERPGERVALKATIDPASAGGFREEFAALHQLRHPGLPRYYELFEHGGSAYLVMELVPGQSLEERLAERPHGLDEREVLDLARQLCAVLAYLHGRRPPILHRDIKPANIRRTPAGVVKLVDFGLLKQGGAQTRLTIRGVGTPAYAPLEQYGGGGMTDPRSDIYSLGATLYHLLTGREPPAATERVAAALDPLQAPERVNGAVSRRTGEAVLRAMALTQGQRWPSAEAFAQGLGAGTGGALAEGLRELWERWRQSRARQRRQRYQLAGHGGAVWCAGYSPDGQTLASGGGDHVLRLWRVADGEELRALRGHTAEVMCLAWRPDGQALASGGGEGVVLVWEVGAGGLRHQLRGHGAGVLSLAWHPSGQTLASAGQDGAVLLWRLDGEGEPTPEELGRHSRMAIAVSFSPDGSSLASVGLDGKVQVWWP